MSAAQRSPVLDMSQQQRSLSTDEASESLRKRVCKACDRCRLKKSKCDGASPCSRCKADNSICVFGERKKSHDKVYPKGYVEMLEQQQSQLVSGLQELYRRSLAGKPWLGPALVEEAGHPLTHDILAALDLLEHKHDGSGDVEQFEEDCEKLQARLFRAGAPSIRRKGSFSSESDHSQRNSISTAQTTPDTTKAAVFKEALHFSPSPSPFSQSPAPGQRRSIPSPVHQSPLHQSTPLANDPQFFAQEWSLPQNPDMLIRSKFAMQAPSMQQNHFADEVADMFRNDQQWMAPNDTFSNAQFVSPYTGVQTFGDFGASIDPMELDFNRYIQVSTS